MIKRQWIIICLLLFGFTLVSCNSGGKPEETPDVVSTALNSMSDDGVSTTPETEATIRENLSTETEEPSSVFVTEYDTTAPSIVETPSSDLTEEDDSTPHIVWVRTLFTSVNEEQRTMIQEFINEKGIDCQIDFINSDVVAGEEFIELLSERRAKGLPTDIGPACVWPHGTYDAYRFVEQEFIPLNTYLDTEEGEKLRANFALLEWAWTSVNGSLYIIPFRTDQLFDELDNTSRLDLNVYLYINDRYADYFGEGFDGTYTSLKEVYEKIPGEKPQIAIPLGSSTVMRLLGEYVSIGRLNYDRNARKVFDIRENDHAKELLFSLYEDARNGIWLGDGIGETDRFSENALAVWTTKTDAFVEPEGFTEIVFWPSMNISTTGQGYGILQSSKHQELAWQVLCACYSDPKIASLLCGGEVDEARWLEITEFYNSQAPSELTGFFPRLSEEQVEALFEYYSDYWQNVAGAFYIKDKNGDRILNPQFEEMVTAYFDRTNEYGDILDASNEQLVEWFENKTQE